jgi:hypothetical protein
MSKKPNAPRVPGISDPELLRPRVLKNLLELMEDQPPLGDRYEEKLRLLIFDAYQNSNGDLGEREQTFLDEVFTYATDYGEMDEFFDTRKSAKYWSMVPIKYSLRKKASYC